MGSFLRSVVERARARIRLSRGAHLRAEHRVCRIIRPSLIEGGTGRVGPTAGIGIIVHIRCEHLRRNHRGLLLVGTVACRSRSRSRSSRSRSSTCRAKITKARRIREHRARIQTESTHSTKIAGINSTVHSTNVHVDILAHVIIVVSPRAAGEHVERVTHDEGGHARESNRIKA